MNAAVIETIGCDRVEWIDFPFDATKTWKDDEWKGLDFLDPVGATRRAWLDFWPQRGRPPYWDAVGRIYIGGAEEWLLVEAKANVEEIQSSCQASISPNMDLRVVLLRQLLTYVLEPIVLSSS